MTATIRLGVSRGFSVQAPYNAEWVEIIKRAIPHFERTWDDETKEWSFAADALTLVREKCLTVGKWPVKVIHPDGLIEVYHLDGGVERQQQQDLFA